MAERRLKVLVCAHELSPRQGSECAVGWQVVTRLARHHDVTVLCASGAQSDPSIYRTAVEDHIRVHGAIEGLVFVFVDQPRGARFLAAINRRVFRNKRGTGFRPLFYGALRLWHREAYRQAVALGPDRFDVVHHVTPIAFWAGGNLWKLGRPYVWGPISGVGGYSPPFARWLGVKAVLFEVSRAAFNALQILVSVSLRRAVRGSAVILAVGPEEAAMVRRLGGGQALPMLDTAAPSMPDVVRRSYDGSSVLRLCWAANHIDRKALPLLLHAIATSELRGRIELHVLGDGPRTSAWKALAQRLDLENIVWHGRLSHAAALAEMGRQNALVHTSIREATSCVVLEAMAQGLPVLCHDISGMSVAVTDACGIKVPLRDPETSISAFREAVERLIGSPGLVENLSAGALIRASQLTWEAKAAEIAAVHERCARRAERPQAVTKEWHRVA
jgi:glycosyltransferase involved in cell wall biosynthesis